MACPQLIEGARGQLQPKLGANPTPKLLGADSAAMNRRPEIRGDPLLHLRRRLACPFSEAMTEESIVVEDEDVPQIEDQRLDAPDGHLQILTPLRWATRKGAGIGRDRKSTRL